MSLAAWPFFLLGLVFLITSSAFFSGSETALMAVDRWRIRHLARKRRRARLVEKTLKEPEKLIGTILLGNNLVNVAATALATSIAISLVGESGVIWATLIMTLLILSDLPSSLFSRSMCLLRYCTPLCEYCRE
jgi:Mg2+/Co2+ transporter CorB